VTWDVRWSMLTAFVNKGLYANSIAWLGRLDSGIGELLVL
jgi:hypothetical protein